VNDALPQDNAPIRLTVDAHARDERVPKLPIPRSREVRAVLSPLVVLIVHDKVVEYPIIGMVEFVPSSKIDILAGLSRW
jgi:hypothetical protein